MKTPQPEMGDPIERCKKAFCEDDAHLFGELLERHPELKSKINEPVADFDSPLITSVRSRKMLDVLLAAGADINAKSSWWAGGFGLLHTADPDLANYAIERGAVVDVHAAARLGKMDRLRALISASPELVHARGGDGQTPLHFASTVEVAKFLLDQGAEIDARDVDHESTPAQWMVADRQKVLRYLIERGCKTDILMAAALGDADLVRSHLDANPNCIRLRVSNEHFPMINDKTGGTIYQWTLGWYVSAHQVAKQFGHEEVFTFLIERSSPEIKLLAACWLGEESTVLSLLEDEPNLWTLLTEGDRDQLAHAARNNNLSALCLMLRARLPLDARSQHRATALHWAAWHGNAEMTEKLLLHHPALEDSDNEFKSRPIGWAIHGSENGWHRKSGNYAETIEKLLKAGARLPDKIGGTTAVREVLRRWGLKD